MGEDNGLRRCREESRVRDTEGQAGDTEKGRSAVTFHPFHLAAHPTIVKQELREQRVRTNNTPAIWAQQP